MKITIKDILIPFYTKYLYLQVLAVISTILLLKHDINYVKSILGIDSEIYAILVNLNYIIPSFVFFFIIFYLFLILSKKYKKVFVILYTKLNPYFLLITVSIIIQFLYKIIVGRYSFCWEGWKSEWGYCFDPYVHDIALNFNLGLFRHNIFEGWPSGHMLVLSSVIFYYVISCRFNKKKFFWSIVLTFPILFIFFLSISTNLHWFSDITAALLIGLALAFSLKEAIKRKGGL